MTPHILFTSRVECDVLLPSNLVLPLNNVFGGQAIALSRSKQTGLQLNVWIAPYIIRPEKNIRQVIYPLGIGLGPYTASFANT